MDNARVNRRTPQTYHKKSCKRDRIGLHRKAQDKNPADKNPGSQQNHFTVAKPIGNDSADESSGSNPYIEQRGKTGRTVCSNPFYLNKIGTCPLHSRSFCSTVSEKSKQKKRNPFDLKRTGQTYTFSVLPGCTLVHIPYRQSNKQKQCNAKLYQPNHAITAVPCPVCQCIAHNERTDDGTDAPEAMQPAHMLRFIMKRDIVVKCCVNGSRSQPVRNSKNNQHPEPAGKGKAEQRNDRKKNTGNGYDSRAEFSGQLIRKKTRDNCSARDNHRYDAHIGHRHAEFGMHHRPAGSQK